MTLDVASAAVAAVTPTLLASAPAITLAVVAAGCFAVAASLQHDAVDTVAATAAAGSG
jgi:hypothetical protein